MPEPIRPAHRKPATDSAHDHDDRCGICDAPGVYVIQTEGNRRFGGDPPESIDARRCASPGCPSNNGTARLGDAV